MRKTTLAALALLSTTAAALASPRPNHPLQQDPQGQQGLGHVDLVIALDTSSSMDGLIDSARAKLWDVVNLLATAKPRPVLRVGLISYGNTGYDAQSGWVRKDSDLTTDLDGIYAKLFALRTNGGEEYVARAVHSAVGDMKWDQDQRTLKILFVAGNEGASQDPKISVESAVHEARQRGIFVNAIYCGSDRATEAGGWRQVASLGSGKYAAIDHNKVVAVATPMDAELNRLSGELNKTYVAYGATGGEHAANQMAQDRNASGVSAPAAASRATAKGSGLYRNDDWDLVDAKKGGKDLAKVKADELPAAMRGMNAAQRQAYVDGKAKERETIQKQIAEVATRREHFIKAERAKRSRSAPADLDDAMGAAVRSEAEAKGFAF